MGMLTAKNAEAIELVTNGSFETGDLTGWTVVDSSSDSFYVYSGETSSRMSFPVLPPQYGTYAAVTDRGVPGSHILYQDIMIPSSGTVTFSAVLSMENSAGEYFKGLGFDHTVPPNQHIRVDIMDPAAPVYDVGNGVLLNIYQTNPGDPASLPYTPLSADLTPFAGRTVRIRIGEVDNLGVFIVALDNVSVTHNPFIDFDRDPAGAPIPAGSAVNTAYAPWGVTFSCSGGACTGTNVYNAGSALAASAPNTVSIYSSFAALDSVHGIVRADFGACATNVTLQAVGDDHTDPAFLHAYDGSGTLVASDRTTGTAGAGEPELLTVHHPDITFVEFAGQTGDTVAFDNMTVTFAAGGTDTDGDGLQDNCDGDDDNDGMPDGPDTDYDKPDFYIDLFGDSWTVSSADLNDDTFRPVWNAACQQMAAMVSKAFPGM